MAQARDQAGVREQTHRAERFYIDDGGLVWFGVAQERDDAVVARRGGLHHAVVAADSHARAHGFLRCGKYAGSTHNGSKQKGVTERAVPWCQRPRIVRNWAEEMVLAPRAPTRRRTSASVVATTMWRSIAAPPT